MLQARLVPQAEVELKTEVAKKPPTPKTNRMDTLEVLEELGRHFHFTATTIYELVWPVTRIMYR